MSLSPVYTTTVNLATNANNAVVVTSISSVRTQLTATSFLSGPSAYAVAVANGFTGTQVQWLASLVGPSTALTSQPISTTNFTATSNSFNPVNPTTAALTVTLPTSVSGQIIDIKNVAVATSNGTTAYPVNVTGVINGATTTVQLFLAGQAIYLVADQTGGWNGAANDLRLSTLDSRYQGNIGYTPENVANKNTSGGVTSSNTTYPSDYSVFTSLNAANAYARDRANHIGVQAESTVTNLVSDLAAKASLASPALTGTPTTPTPASTDNSTTIATTAYVTTAILNAASTYDDVRDYANLAAFPATGQTGYIYVADDTGFLYRWGGSSYTKVGGGTPADATTANKGIVQLAGDLGGVAASPTVVQATASVAGKTLLGASGGAATFASDAAKVAKAGDTMTGILNIQANGVMETFKDTAGSISAGGLWREVVNAAARRWDMNTAVAGDFSTYVTPLTLKTDAVGVFKSPTSGIALDINGTIQSTTLKLPNGATNGYYLKTDASGNASWAAAPVTSVASKTGAVSLVESDIANLPTDLAAKVPNTRQVISGAGLTGGGDLTADRTLAVTYGTTANTAAQGNDSRFAASAATRNSTITVGPTGSAADYVCTGTNDGAVIQTAVNALPVTGGRVLIRNGTYSFNASTDKVSVNIGKVSIEGESVGGVTFKANATLNAGGATPYYGMLTLGKTNTGLITDLYVKNIIFDCNNQVLTSGFAIFGGVTNNQINTQGIIIENVKVLNANTDITDALNSGVYVISGFQNLFSNCGYVDRVRFINVEIANSKVDGIWFRGTNFTNISFYHCWIHDSGRRGVTYYSYGTNNSPSDVTSSDWLFEYCRFENNMKISNGGTGSLGDFHEVDQYGINNLTFDKCYFGPAYNTNGTSQDYSVVIYSAYNNRISNCVFDRNGSGISLGLSISGSTASYNPLNRFFFENNFVYQSRSCFDNDSNITAVFKDNIFYEIRRSSIWKPYSRHSPTIIDNNVIYNCHTEVPDSDPEYSKAAIALAAEAYIVRNNTVIDDRLLANPTVALAATTVTGGSLGAHTVYATYAYQNDTGQTLAAIEQSVSVAANSLAKFSYNSSLIPTGAKKLVIYASSTTGTETLQTSITLPNVVLSWTEPITGIVTGGAALPSSNTTRTMTKYGIYEPDGGSQNTYVPVYSNNHFIGISTPMLINTAYRRIRFGNTADTSYASGDEYLLEKTPYSQGSVTGATTFNVMNGEVIKATLTGNITAIIPLGEYIGQALTLILAQDSTGNRTIAWPGNVVLQQAGLVLSTAASTIDVVSFIWDGTNWQEVNRSLGRSIYDNPTFIGSMKVVSTAGYTNQVPVMTSNTAPSGVASASTEANGLNLAYNAFDNDATSKWTASASTGYLRYDFGSGNQKVISQYVVTGPVSGQPTLGPKTWTFEGSNDGSTWTVLDTQTNVATWSAIEQRAYTITNTQYYRYYQMNISANQGSASNLSVVRLVLNNEAIIGRITPSGDILATGNGNIQSSLFVGAKGNSTSTLQSAGSFATAITTKTGAYTLTVADSAIEVNTTATMTLPALSTCPGREYILVNIQASGTNATIAGNGTEVIGNTTASAANTFTLASGATLHLKAFSGAWRIM